MKSNWEINEEDLDIAQTNVRRLKVDKNFVIKGVAGSGKTNLALWRAKRILETEKGTAKVLVYTKALSAFIADGIRQLEIGSANVIHYQKWKQEDVDYIIVDEAHDFTEVEIRKLVGRAKKSIMFFGDTNQQLYENKKSFITNQYEDTVNMEQIATILECEVKELPNNYRLPQGIAPFAQSINPQNNDIVSNCKNRKSNKPRVIEFNSWTDELDFIIKEIKNRNLNDVAILLPFNKKDRTGSYQEFYSVENVKNYFNEKGVKNLYKIDNTMELDFDADLPKIMTYHSAKGLQFDTVFIPHCGIEWSKFKNALYVATTRTSNNLIITFSDSLSPFVSNISSAYYE